MMPSCKINLPIGYDNFRDIIEQNFTFVDKTLFIQNFLTDNAQVALITRPRRFGKTLNLSMLHHFFAQTVYGKPTKNLFTQLKIAKIPSALSHQGRYPVIALTFKDIKEKDFNSAYKNLCRLLSRVFKEHIHILDSPKLTDEQKYSFEAILQEKAEESTVKTALLDLTDCLYQHYGEKTILLIDEYDTPIQSGYFHQYYESITQFIRQLLSTALKSNPYLYRAMLTGILRISKESLFSDLNNLKVYSIFNETYSEYFGFTEQETHDLLKEIPYKIEEIKHWYNGYQIGRTLIYNPWSIANCIQEKGILKPYWINTSNHTLIKNLLMKASVDLKLDFESMLKGQSVERLIDENFVFQNLDKNETAIWSLLLASGYLKPVYAAPAGTKIRCQLLPPNQEVICLYKDIIQEWFTDPMGEDQYHQFLISLTTGKIDEFNKKLELFLLETASQFDTQGRHPEKFYHGLVLGLVASLGQTHMIQSNRESGYGRYDVILIPKDPTQLGIILEFKSLAFTKSTEKIKLKQAAQEALKQIEIKAYRTELMQKGIKNIVEMGLAFSGKKCHIETKFIHDNIPLVLENAK